MEQRRLRLGDILDDYCPRERRVTNHAVVAMIEEDVKQTRCTTCDAEHVYKGGKAPRRKKETRIPPAPSTRKSSPASKNRRRRCARATPAPRSSRARTAPEASLATSSPKTCRRLRQRPRFEHRRRARTTTARSHLLPLEEGPVHRPLIRAQLPRPEGQKIERQAPEFTIRQNTGRGGPGGGFRGRSQGGAATATGRAAAAIARHGGPNRRTGAGSGGGRGPSRASAADLVGGGQPRQGGPRKRSR